VADEGVVALALGRHAAPEAVVRVVLGEILAPLVEAERGIGDDDVEPHQVVALDQAGAGDGVAPLDAGIIHGVQEHVHAAQRPGGAVGLLAVEGEVLGADLLGDADEQRTGAAGGVADGVAGLAGP
jgi:hypothetical protein